MGKGAGLFSIAKTDDGGFAQAMGDSMGKAGNTKKTEPSEQKGKGRKRPVDPRARTSPSSEPQDNALALKDSHGKAKVVLLPVGPYTVHVYWEQLNPERQEAASKTFGQGFTQSQPVLRFYDVTNIVFDGTNAHGFFDIPVDLPSEHCYVHLWSAQKTYFVDIGWKDEQGRFFCAGRSNTAHTPSAWPAQGRTHLPGQSSNASYQRRNGLTKTQEKDCLDPTSKGKTKQRLTPFTSTEDAWQTNCSTAVAHKDVDLTAINEEAFAFGMSSDQAPSSPKGKNSRED